MLKPGIILVTSSGETGNAVYVNELFQGAIGSPDLLRILPDQERIRVGYLYAFLGSRFGKGLLTQGTYGGVIPHIEAAHVLDLPVPRLDDSMEAAIHELVEQAASKRVEANERLRAARDRVYEVTGLPRRNPAPVGRNLAGARTFSIPQSQLGSRFEARYHDTFVRELRDDIEAAGNSAALADLTVSVHEQKRYKLFNATKNGLPFIGSGEMFASRPRPHRLLSRRIPEIEELLVAPGTILVAKSGQIYSILGDVVMVGRSLTGIAVSWHALRILPDPQKCHPGFLYAFLSLPDYGYGQIVSTAYGTSIPEISTEDVKRVRVSLPDEDDREAIGLEVMRAVTLRDEANDLEDEAQALLRDALGLAAETAGEKP